jgi:hypothetical protein
MYNYLELGGKVLKGVIFLIVSGNRKHKCFPSKLSVFHLNCKKISFKWKSIWADVWCKF